MRLDPAAGTLREAACTRPAREHSPSEQRFQCRLLAAAAGGQGCQDDRRADSDRRARFLTARTPGLAAAAAAGGNAVGFNSIRVGLVAGQTP